jgi:hypothetical protein
VWEQRYWPARENLALRKGKHAPLSDLPDRPTFLNEQGDAYLNIAHILWMQGQGEHASHAAESAVSCYARKGNLVSVARVRELGGRAENT